MSRMGLVCTVLMIVPCAAGTDAVKLLEAVRGQHAALANHEVTVRMRSEGDSPSTCTLQRIVFRNKLRRFVQGSWKGVPHFVFSQTADGRLVSNWNAAGTAGYLGSIRPQTPEKWTSSFNVFYDAPWMFGLVERDPAYIWDVMMKRPETLKAREIADAGGRRIEISSVVGGNESKLVIDPDHDNRIRGLSYRRGAGTSNVEEGTAEFDQFVKVGRIWVPSRGRLDYTLTRPGQAPIRMTYFAQIDDYKLVEEAPADETFAIKWPAHCWVGKYATAEKDEKQKRDYMADREGALIALDSLEPTHPGIKGTAGIGKEEKARLAKDLRCMASWLIQGQQTDMGIKAIEAAKALEDGGDIEDCSAIQPYGGKMLGMCGLNVDSEIKLRAMILVPEKKE